MRYPFLALLSVAPASGQRLKLRFDQTLGAFWPGVDFGQVYATLAGLERDGLVERQDPSDNQRRDQQVYTLTATGRDALDAWLANPIDPAGAREDLFAKIALARLVGIADPLLIVERQRLRYLQLLHDLTRSGPLPAGPRPSADPSVAGGEPMASLWLEHVALQLEADLKWLDACERAFVTEPAPVALGGHGS